LFLYIFHDLFYVLELLLLQICIYGICSLDFIYLCFKQYYFSPVALLNDSPMGWHSQNISFVRSHTFYFEGTELMLAQTLTEKVV